MHEKQINGRSMTEQEIEAYLERIGMQHPDAWQEAALAQLQWKHMQAIPFENVDIMNGVELTLCRDALYDKMIRRHRGGVCSELNTLYNWLLESLGYEVTSYHSRVISDAVPYPGRSHRVMGVRQDGVIWLTDVGYNYEHHRRPLLLQEGLLQYDGTCCYRLEKDDFYGWVLWQERDGAGWRKKIAFTEDPQIDADYRAATFYAQHHPDSKINKALKVSRYVNGVFYAIRQGNFLTEHSGVEEILEPDLSKHRETELLHRLFALPDDTAVQENHPER